MCLYLDNIPNNISVLDIKNSLQNLNYKIEMCRRVGKQTLNSRPILIKVHNIDEKIKMFHDVDIKTIHPDVHVRNYDIKYNSLLYEKTHSKYCKFALNVPKYSSTSACMAEMGRYPLSFKIWSLCIKYWMRLANGTNNVLLNNAFQTVKEENHEWLQNIKYLLNLHGFGKQWNNPIVNHEVYIKHFIWTFRKRLEDQYIQFWENKCLNSELYNNIHILNNTYCSGKYLDRIKNPIIRSNVTKIRVGMSKFRFYTGHRFDKSQTCTNCDANMLETAEHVLLECKFFDSVRNIFNHKMQNKLYMVCAATERNLKLF